MADREGKADAQPFHLDPPRAGLDRLPEPLPDRHRRASRRLLLQAAHRPRATWRSTAQGLIGLSACLNGEVARALEIGRLASRHAASPAVRATSSAGRLLPRAAGPRPARAARAQRASCCASARRSGLPLVATNDLHYVRREQSEAHDVLLCVGTGSNLDTPGRMRFETPDFYLKTAAEMARALRPTLPEAISNTPAHRRDDRPGAAVRPAAPARLPGPGRPHGRVAGCAPSASAACASATARSPTSSSSASTTSSASSPRWATRATS